MNERGRTTPLLAAHILVFVDLVALWMWM